jgi:glutaredoxin 1
MYNVLIYGHNGCFYCRKAKTLADKLYTKDYIYNYQILALTHDVKNMIENITCKQITTIPQIMIDDHHIGGYTEFEKWAKECLGFDINDPVEELEFYSMNF